MKALRKRYGRAVAQPNVLVWTEERDVLGHTWRSQVVDFGVKDVKGRTIGAYAEIFHPALGAQGWARVPPER
jgi:hypothetical protein